MPFVAMWKEADRLVLPAPPRGDDESQVDHGEKGGRCEVLDGAGDDAEPFPRIEASDNPRDRRRMSVTQLMADLRHDPIQAGRIPHQGARKG